MKTTIATREEQKQEAIARMRYLKLYPQVIKEFEKEELVNYSRGGILYWVEGEMYDLMREFEKSIMSWYTTSLRTTQTSDGCSLSCMYPRARTSGNMTATTWQKAMHLPM